MRIIFIISFLIVLFYLCGCSHKKESEIGDGYFYRKPQPFLEIPEKGIIPELEIPVIPEEKLPFPPKKKESKTDFIC